MSLEEGIMSWPRILLGLVWFRVIKGDSLGNSLPADQH
jgi:hypothetical protein